MEKTKVKHRKKKRFKKQHKVILLSSLFSVEMAELQNKVRQFTDQIISYIFAYIAIFYFDKKFN